MYLFLTHEILENENYNNADHRGVWLWRLVKGWMTEGLKDTFGLMCVFVILMVVMNS